jgi:hypothetical protein
MFAGERIALGFVLGLVLAAAYGTYVGHLPVSEGWGDVWGGAIGAGGAFLAALWVFQAGERRRDQERRRTVCDAALLYFYKLLRLYQLLRNLQLYFDDRTDEHGFPALPPLNFFDQFPYETAAIRSTATPIQLGPEAVADWEALLREIEEIGQRLNRLPDPIGITAKVEALEKFRNRTGITMLNTFRMLNGYRDTALHLGSKESLLIPPIPLHLGGFADRLSAIQIHRTTSHKLRS